MLTNEELVMNILITFIVVIIGFFILQNINKPIKKWPAFIASLSSFILSATIAEFLWEYEYLSNISFFFLTVIIYICKLVHMYSYANSEVWKYNNRRTKYVGLIAILSYKISLILIFHQFYLSRKKSNKVIPKNINSLDKYPEINTNQIEHDESNLNSKLSKINFVF